MRGFLIGMIVYMILKIIAGIWIPVDYLFFAGAATGIILAAIWKHYDDD